MLKKLFLLNIFPHVASSGTFIHFSPLRLNLCRFFLSYLPLLLVHYEPSSLITEKRENLASDWTKKSVDRVKEHLLRPTILRGIKFPTKYFWIYCTGGHWFECTSFSSLLHPLASAHTHSHPLAPASSHLYRFLQVASIHTCWHLLKPTPT